MSDSIKIDAEKEDDGTLLNDDPAPDTQINHHASLKYWDSVSPDVNGMLGGYPQVSGIDLRGSKAFLAKLRRLSPSAAQSVTLPISGITSLNNNDNKSTYNPKKLLRRGVDCGAGIGRVTAGFLSQVCEVVDIVEPVAKFARVLEESELKRAGKVGDVFIVGLESWEPSKRYDLIWNQWCVGHLTDAQLVSYLRRCGRSLATNGEEKEEARGPGWIVLKENLSTQPFGEDRYEELDSSVTRSDVSFRRIFEEAGLRVVKAEVQTGFPKGLGLYPVKMYALRPK